MAEITEFEIKRTKLGLSRRQMAERLKVSDTTIYNYEKGVCQPSPGTQYLLDSMLKEQAMVKLADYTNDQLVDLVGEIHKELLRRKLLTQ